MAASSEVVSEYILEDKIIDMWPNYPCIFDVRSPHFKNREKRQKAHEEMAKELNQTGSLLENQLL